MMRSMTIRILAVLVLAIIGSLFVTALFGEADATANAIELPNETDGRSNVSGSVTISAGQISRVDVRMG